MITALDNTSTLTGPGATTGQSARIRTFELDETASGTSAQAEASAVVSLSAQATRLAASETAAPSTAAASSPPTSGASTTASAGAQAASTPAPTAPTAKAPTTSTATSSTATPSAASTTASSATSGKPVTLVPNLVYDPADTDQNGVVSPTERRSYDVVHDAVPRPASATDNPPRRVVDAELREYTAIANTRG